MSVGAAQHIEFSSGRRAMKPKPPFNLKKIFKSGVDYWVGGYKYFT